MNLSDPQLGDPEWVEDHQNRKILEHTVSELIKRAKPDLITISGDLAWAGYDHAYIMLAKLLEQYQIPWAPIWGNHDNQNGPEHIEKIVTEYLTFPHCIYEKGDPALGNGNYVICIQENEKTVEAVFMMDSHDREPYVDENGNTSDAWAKLIPQQLVWYKEQVAAVKAQGCTSSTLILHIPIYEYRKVAPIAYKNGIDLCALTVEDTEGTACWNVGYEDSVGVQHENVSSFPADDGVFAAIKESGITQRVIAGHDHVNNWIVKHDGVQLIFALKAGPGCYWEPKLNGGTILKINRNGVYDVFHEYVDITHLL